VAAVERKLEPRAWLPRALEPRLGQLRRDLRAVVAGLRGERAPAWLPRDGSRYPSASEPATAGLAVRELEVAEVIRETASAVSLVLRDPHGQPLPALRPGQFFTVLVELGAPGSAGETLRRAYSISSDCRERERVSLTIKRVAGGRVSNHLNDEARPGMRLRVLGPSGEFGVAPDPERGRPRKLVLIAGGSGITPMMALIRTLLPSEADCTIALIYANRSPEQVIFADALRELEAAHPPRLILRELLEQPPADWPGARGRCDRPTLAALLDALPLAGDPEAEFMLCGPTPMMDGALELLGERGVEPGRIHKESFFSPSLADSQRVPTRPQAVTFVLPGREVGLLVQPGQTLLEAGLAAGLALPYSCTMGGCGACKQTVERGAVIMREPNCLSADERAAGSVLACVSQPSGPCRVLVSDESQADGDR
jgi:ring-1,2-phenylacetyl-CoA epoxidase subunit PaaE